MNNDDPMYEVTCEELCPRIGNSDPDPDPFAKFFENEDVAKTLKRGGLSKSVRAEILGLDADELELADLVRGRSRTVGKTVQSPIDLDALSKSNPRMKRACGYFDHILGKSFTLDEALERAAELVSDDASPEQWRLLAQARKALDISGFLTILTDIFAKDSI